MRLFKVKKNIPIVFTFGVTRRAKVRGAKAGQSKDPSTARAAPLGHAAEATIADTCHSRHDGES
jgi:hypothetical protein